MGPNGNGNRGGKPRRNRSSRGNGNGNRNNGRNGHNNQNNNRSRNSNRFRNNRQNDNGRRRQSDAERAFLSGTAVNPYPRIQLERGCSETTVRALDLICPIGMGQRALIVSSPGSGKTTFLKHICNGVTKGYPELKTYCLLVDERPEEVTDFRRSVQAEVFSSSMDEQYERHIEVVNRVMDRAFTEAAAGENVVILFDSLTRLGRVYNAKRAPGGRTMSGGIDAGALEIPRKIFGAARNVEGMGSITIVASALVETGSRMDDFIFEEFKGTGNMELVLSRKLASNWIFPAIDIPKSGTRRMELLFDSAEFGQIELLHKVLRGGDPRDIMERLVALMNKYPTNRELLQALEVRA